MIILGNGFFVPSPTDWQAIGCPIETQAIACQFELIDPDLSWSAIKSFILFRRSFKHLNLKINDKDYKCLPSQDLGLFTLPPIPQSLANQAIESSIEVIKIQPFRQYTYTDPNWRVQLYGVL
jgi:hypothetical protein